jgi:hypothetical protein
VDTQAVTLLIRSVPALVKAINDYVRSNNNNAQPFIWTATADTIIRKVRRYKRASETGLVVCRNQMF